MKFFTVIFLNICCIFRLIGATSSYQSEIQCIAQESGLANNTLMEIHQDKKGFLWIGTDVGLSRYDGINFHNFSIEEREPQAVKRICEAEKDDLLWLKLNNNHRIACFDKNKGNFVSLESTDSIFLNDIHDLCMGDSVLYAITSKGLSRVDYQKEKNSILIFPTLIYEHPLSLVNLQEDKVYLYATDEENNILIYNKRSGNKQILEYKRLNTNKPVENIYAINNFLWISTLWNGTYCYNPNTDELRCLKSNDGHLEKLSISSLDAKNNTLFIAATPHSILYISFSGEDYIQSTINVEEMTFDNSSTNSFIKNRITKLYIDKENSVIWLGTFGKGLIKSNMQDKNIHRILLSNEIKDINGLAQDAQGYIWLTTDRNGIWKSTSKKVSPDLKFEIWEPNTKGQYHCMYKDAKGGLWIAGESGTVKWLNPLTNKITSYVPKYDGINSIGNIQKIYLCIHNRLWMTTSKGLFIYDFIDDKCVAYMPYNEVIKKITSLAEDGDGVMWLGTNDGIRSAEIVNGIIKLKNGREQKAGISKSEVLAVYVNRHNQLYVSYADKIVQTDGMREGVYDIKYLQKDMLSGHTTCIIDDKSGNTWMGNNIGIMTIQNNTKASYTYSFPERFYNVCQLNDGRLMWSNSLGLMYFDPIELKERSVASKLYISDIDINYNKVEVNEEIGGQIILKEPVYKTDELVLNHSNNNIVFYLTDLNYSQMLNKIQYRLLPNDQKWTSSYESKIELSNLNAGNYTLEVRPISINEEEVPTTYMKIRIKKHWAITPLAILVYLVVAIVFTWLTRAFFKAKSARRLYYRKKEALLKTSLSEEIKNRKEENTAYKLRNQVRYGVVSELRTPLSLVIAPLKDMLTDTNISPTLAPKAKVAYRNAISMQNICNMMLDIYEHENEDRKLEIGSYSISEIINCAIASSNELLNVAPIKLHFDKLNKVKKEVWIDRKKTEYMFRNILSNAYRHISFSGNVYINIYTENIEDKEYCCCLIKDDGKNTITESATFLISEEQEGYELADQLMPELGLALMKDNIVAHHGDIKIIKDKESGTSVIVYIPVGKDHFENDSNVSFVEAEELQSTEIVSVEEKEKQQNQEEEEINSSIPAANTKHKILIIEDHKDIRLYMKILFSSKYTLVMAENGEEGIRLAHKEMPDIIISDVMMPGQNGFECTKILKEDIKTCHIPIILLTALVGDTNMVKGLEVGADDYILKPFNPEVLLSKVKRLIKNRLDLKQTYMKLMMANNTVEGNTEEEQKEDPFIRQIFDIVEKNLQNPDFNVKRLAEMLNMSQPTLYRRVKMLTNYTIIELIRGVRLKCAADLLRTKKYSIQEVSEMIGYNDTPTFRKHFVDFYGTTPSTFLNKEETKVQNLE